MLDYQALDETLARSRANAGAAESQGMLCGLLCAHADPRAAWLAEMYDDPDGADVLAREGRKVLEQLYADCRRELGNGGLTFMLMLPDDGAPLARRGEALRNWCQGFLYGFGLSGRNVDDLPEDSRELLRDISEIARLALPEDDNEEDETAFAEIVEYLRMGVLLINEELNPVRQGPVTLH